METVKKPCGDCIIQYGRLVCTMNCGPAITSKSHLGDNGITTADQIIQAATVVDDTPEEHQAAALKLARLDWEVLHTAMRVAQLCHKGQVDKGGEPYIWHVLRVGIKLLPDIDAAVAGVLHDVLEDCPLVTEAELLYGAGGNQEILHVLKLLKKEPDEDYGAYLERCESHPLARKVKLADLDDNLDPRRGRRAAFRVGPDRILALKNKYKAAVAFLEAEQPSVLHSRPQDFPG
jgi:hypothetical protein